MFGLGWPEVIVISIVAVAIFGAKKIPEVGRAIGQTLRGFREELKSESDKPDNPDRDNQP